MLLPRRGKPAWAASAVGSLTNHATRAGLSKNDGLAEAQPAPAKAYNLTLHNSTAREAMFKRITELTLVLLAFVAMAVIAAAGQGPAPDAAGSGTIQGELFNLNGQAGHAGVLALRVTDPQWLIDSGNAQRGECYVVLADGELFGRLWSNLGMTVRVEGAVAVREGLLTVQVTRFAAE